MNTIIERKLLKMFDDEASLDEINDYIFDVEDEYDGYLIETAFTYAVQHSHMDFLEDHVEDVDLNYDDGTCGYIDETDDEDVITFLINNGACRPLDDYSDCKFAYETANGYVIAFDVDFRKEVFNKYCETYSLTIPQIISIIKGTEEEPESCCVSDNMDTLGISFKDGQPVYDNTVFEKEIGTSIGEILTDQLGYELAFEGDSWRFECMGVFFIK